MRPVLLIGPSGAGKTVLGQQAAKQLGWAFIEWDAYLAEYWQEPVVRAYRRLGPEAFFRESLLLLEELQLECSTLVDIGAGNLVGSAQSKEPLFSWSVFSLQLSVVEAYARIKQSRADPRTQAQYAAQEYSPDRRILYQRAFPIDISGLTLSEAVSHMVEVIGCFVEKERSLAERALE